jgi:hypothetical protein
MSFISVYAMSKLQIKNSLGVVLLTIWTYFKFATIFFDMKGAKPTCE